MAFLDMASRMTQDPRNAAAQIDRIGGPVPLGGKRPVDEIVQRSRQGGALGDDTSSEEEPSKVDFTVLFDPRRDVVEPERNPYTELTPTEKWLKDELAQGRQKRDNSDWYFAANNLGLTTREIYEREMGAAMADHAADQEDQAAVAQQQAVATKMQELGVASVGQHPETGAPVLLDANGQQIYVDGPSDEYAQYGGVPSVLNTDQPTYDVTRDAGFFTGNGQQTDGQQPQTGGGPQEGQSGPATVPVPQVDRTAYVEAGKTLQRLITERPKLPELPQLEKPGIAHLAMALLFSMIDRNNAGGYLAMPFQVQLQRRQQAIDQIYKKYQLQEADWKIAAGLAKDAFDIEADRLKEAEQRQDKAIEFNAKETNDKTKSDADRASRERVAAGKAAEGRKKQIGDTLKGIFSGPNSTKFTQEQRDWAAQKFAELYDLPEMASASDDSPVFDKLEQDIRNVTARARKAESDADVAEATEDDRIKLAEQRALKAVEDVKLSKNRGDLVAKQIKWFDAKAQAEIAQRQASVSNTADMIRSRRVRDKLALSKEERTGVVQSLTRGQIELERLRREGKQDREQIAYYETELDGYMDGGQHVAGSRERLAELRSVKKPTPEQLRELGQLERTVPQAEARLKELQDSLQMKGDLYQQTAKDVEELRRASSVKALGDKDDRKVEIGPYTFNLGGKYVFGAKGEQAKDCSGFVQAAMKSGGIDEFPGSCRTQLEYLQSGKGKKRGFQDVLDKVLHNGDPLEEGDLLYLQGSPPPKGSGYHVKTFAGYDASGKPVWMEAKGSSSGIGTFVDEVKGKKVFGLFRPPKN